MVLSVVYKMIMIISWRSWLRKSSLDTHYFYGKIICLHWILTSSEEGNYLKFSARHRNNLSWNRICFINTWSG